MPNDILNTINSISHRGQIQVIGGTTSFSITSDPLNFKITGEDMEMSPNKKYVADVYVSLNGFYNDKSQHIIKPNYKIMEIYLKRGELFL